MKQLCYLVLVMVLISGKCKHDETDEVPEDPQKAVQELSMKNVQVIPASDAVAMIRHSFDSTLTKRDFSLGAISKAEMKLIASLPGFQRLIMVRANALKTDEPVTLAAIYFAPSPDATAEESQIVYTVVTVCPPPDASTCYKNYLNVDY